MTINPNNTTAACSGGEVTELHRQSASGFLCWPMNVIDLCKDDKDLPAAVEKLAAFIARWEQKGRTQASAPRSASAGEGVREALIAAGCTSPDGTYVRDDIERVLAAISANTTAGWQPIETAAKDGTPMLFCNWSGPEQDVLPITSGFWSRISEAWYSEMSGQKIRPTHWRPLLAPPVLASNPLEGEVAK